MRWARARRGVADEVGVTTESCAVSVLQNWLMESGTTWRWNDACSQLSSFRPSLADTSGHNFCSGCRNCMDQSKIRSCINCVCRQLKMAEALLVEAKLVAAPAMATRSTCGSWLAARAGAWSISITYLSENEINVMDSHMIFVSCLSNLGPWLADCAGAYLFLFYIIICLSWPLARRLRRGKPPYLLALYH